MRILRSFRFFFFFNLASPQYAERMQYAELPRWNADEVRGKIVADMRTAADGC
jgi:hypothetical protein